MTPPQPPPSALARSLLGNAKKGLRLPPFAHPSAARDVAYRLRVKPKPRRRNISEPNDWSL